MTTHTWRGVTGALVLLLSLAGCASTPNFDYQADGAAGRVHDARDVRIEAELQRTHVELAISNKTAETLRLITDESALTTIDGRTLRLIPGGTVMASRSGAQAPVVIPAGARVQVQLFAADNVVDTGPALGMGDIMPGFGMDRSDHTGKIFSLLLAFRRTNDSRFEETVRYRVTGPKK